jgi:NADH:ubiquinone oxidoreductase subunit E
LEHKECACCKSQGTGNGYQAALRTFERKKDNLIPALHAVQSKLGYLPDEAMLEIAEWLNIPVSEVHGTATFYTMFATEPKGQYIVRLCDSPPCHIEGSSGIKSIIEKELGVKAIWALSLPGKVAPVTAAKFIKETIYNIISELGV